MFVLIIYSIPQECHNQLEFQVCGYNSDIIIVLNVHAVGNFEWFDTKNLQLLDKNHL